MWVVTFVHTNLGLGTSRLCKGSERERDTLSLRSLPHPSPPSYLPTHTREMWLLGRSEELHCDREKAEEKNVAGKGVSCWLEGVHVSPPD